MKKVIRDGKVAVLYSPGYGASWYTWNELVSRMCFSDSELVVLVEQHEFSKVTEYSLNKNMGRDSIQGEPRIYKLSGYRKEHHLQLKNMTVLKTFIQMMIVKLIA